MSNVNEALVAALIATPIVQAINSKRIVYLEKVDERKILLLDVGIRTQIGISDGIAHYTYAWY